MTKTTNYQLNQWAKSDRVMMDDFNADNAKIDAAMKANADAIAAETTARVAGDAALQSAVSACGDCFVEAKTYTGNGKKGSANAIRFTFSMQPQLVFITGYSVTALGVRGCNRALSSDSGGLQMTWSGNKVSWYNDSNYVSHMNNTGSTYTVIALTK